MRVWKIRWVKYHSIIFEKVNISPLLTGKFKRVQISDSEVSRHGLSFESHKSNMWELISFFIVRILWQNSPLWSCLKKFCSQSSISQTFENGIQCILMWSFKWDYSQANLLYWFDQLVLSMWMCLIEMIYGTYQKILDNKELSISWKDSPWSNASVAKLSLL